MERHTKLCKMIYGVFWLFDHAMGTKLKAKCIVVLYYSDGFIIKFQIGKRILFKRERKSDHGGGGNHLNRLIERSMNWRYS